jgi:iron-sulfur cluster insertion protein
MCYYGGMTNLALSPAAAAHIVRVLAKQPEFSHLRLSVSGGGCSGFKYLYTFESGALAPDDVVVQLNGATLVTDNMSLRFIQNATLDFVQDMMGSRFMVTNPNASSSCGCGTSFSLKISQTSIDVPTKVVAT